VGEGRKGLGNGEMGGKDHRSCVFPWGGGAPIHWSFSLRQAFSGNMEGIKRAVQNNNLPFAVPDGRHWLPKASNGPSTILMHTHSACILGGVVEF